MKLLTFSLVLLLAASSAHADASKCDSIRWKLASKAIFAEAKCEAKAAKKDIPLDPECIAKAEEQLLDKWAKAAKKEDCSNTNDMPTILTLVNDTVESLRLQIVPLTGDPSGGTCCTVTEPSVGTLCLYAEESLCTGVGGTPVVDAWCSPNGSCSAAVTSAGDCCDGLTLPTGDTGCAGSNVMSMICSSAGGTLVNNTVCTPTGCATP